MPKRKTAASENDQYQRFLEAARELGCDPADPRIPDVLRGMAAIPHQPRRKGGEKGKGRREPRRKPEMTDYRPSGPI
jgi:hypothetical protein